MGQHTCTISSCGSAVRILSDINLYRHLRVLSKDSSIPDMEVEEGSDTTMELPQLIYEDSEMCEIVFCPHEARIRYPWDKMRSGETLLYASYPLIEYQRQVQRDLTAHTACVNMGDESVLLMGKEGSGKTTVAIDLCQSYNAKVVANDLCVIGERQGEIISRGGTKFFFLRRESITRNLPRLLDFFSASSVEDSWLEKVKVDSYDLGIEAYYGQSAVKHAYMLHVDETKDELNVCNADSLVTRLYLNENFSRYIRSSCTVMTGGSAYDFLGYIPSLDCEQFFEMRKSLITSLLNLGLRYISGPVRLVADYIADSQRHD